MSNIDWYPSDIPLKQSKGDKKHHCNEVMENVKYFDERRTMHDELKYILN
jgi:hypothetical protein